MSTAEILISMLWGVSRIRVFIPLYQLGQVTKRYQEPFVKMYVDLLIQQLGELVAGPAPKEVGVRLNIKIRP